jgi:hypothetical protein
VVRHDLANPAVRRAAIGVVRGVGQDAETQAALIRRWLQSHVQFVRDPDGLEWLTAPADQLRELRANGRIYGDCDDVAVLGAALGLSVGMRARFVMLGPPEQFIHVFTVLGDPRGAAWWELDTTRPMQTIPPALAANVLSIEV